jgi:hypothetical protein
MEVVKVAYKKQPKGEDVNAESRTQSAAVAPVAAPVAPQVQNPMGGAPKVKQWYEPTPIKQQPWATNPTPPANNISVVTPPKWNLADVAKSEGTFVNEFKNLLWERFQSTPEGKRGSLFWQGVKQNPELAAASFVRRALTNMADANSWINGEKPPTMTAAMQNTLANNDTRKWLSWARGKGGMPKVGE